MTANTSSRNYNVLALRGGQVSDEEYVETFGLDPSLAHTPKLNDAMLDMAYKDNIAAGVEEAQANKLRMEAERDIKRLLAKNGMLK